MKSILLVDDEIYARDRLARLIERRGFAVHTAGSGEEGLALYREHRPDFVFLDILLPGIDGEEVFRYIREMDEEANVYFMTGCDDIFTHEQALAMGGRGFITKPVYVDDLVILLDSLKSQGPPVP